MYATTWKKPLRHNTKWNKPETKREIVYDSTYEVHKVVKFIDGLIDTEVQIMTWQQSSGDE